MNAFDTFALDYPRFSGGGSFNVSIDSGASLGAVNINYATTALAAHTFTVSADVHTIKITTESFYQGYPTVIWHIASGRYFDGFIRCRTVRDWSDCHGARIPLEYANDL